MWVLNRHGDKILPHTGAGRVPYRTDDPMGKLARICNGNMNKEMLNPDMQAF